MILRPTPQDYDELLTVWEASVRSTHHFLAEKDIQFYKPLIREQYFLAVELYIIRNEKEEIAAFMGLSDELIEMLFVRPLPCWSGRTNNKVRDTENGSWSTPSTKNTSTKWM